MQSSYTIKVNRGAGYADYHSAEQLVRFFDTGDSHQDVLLSPTENKILLLLIQRAGKVVSREELLTFAWASRVVASGSINQCIFSLRNIIGDDRVHECIQTVPRKGYTFNADALLSGKQCVDFSLRLDGCEPELCDTTTLFKDAQNIEAGCNDISLGKGCEYSGVCPVASSHKMSHAMRYLLGFKKIILLAGCVTCCLLFLLATEIFANSPEIYASQSSVYEVIAGQHKLIVLNPILDSSEIRQATQHLKLFDSKPITIVFHRWNENYGASCIDGDMRALNTSLKIGLSFDKEFIEFLKQCRRVRDV